MEQILLAYGIPKETVAAIRILYRNTKVKVRSPDGDTYYFNIVAGVLQGDKLAPYLFIICLDYVLRTSIVLIFKLCTYATLNRLEWKCFCMLDLIVWNRTVFVIETVIMLTWIFKNRTVLTFNCVYTKCIHILKLIVWIRTVWLNWIAWNRNILDN